MKHEKLEVLTLKEVCDELHIPVSTGYKLFREGQLKGFKIGKHWRMTREELTNYIHTETQKPASEKINHKMGQGKKGGFPQL